MGSVGGVSNQSLSILEGNINMKKLFRVNDNGKITPLVCGGVRSRLEGNRDWFGCTFCNRWFESMGHLEDHYGREHEGADSYQFELLELKTCVIALPKFRLPVFERPVTPTPSVVVDPPTDVKEESRIEPDDAMNLRFSAMALSPRKMSLKKAIRKAIKATQVNGTGSSYKKIKAYLANKTGMDVGRLNKKLRKVLEKFVECCKLERGFVRGKTVYSLPSTSLSPSKKGHGKRFGKKRRIPKEETRRFRDQQLKLLAKSLRPHGLKPHE